MSEPSQKTIDERYKYTPFLEKHSDFQNVFYDKDLESIRKDVNHLSDTLKAMTLRFQRCNTLQIAKSVFDYVTQREFYAIYPNNYFDFRSGDTRICIGQKHKHGKNNYFVAVYGYKPSPEFNKEISEFGYGAYEKLGEAKKLFFRMVDDFLLPKREAFF